MASLVLIDFVQSNGHGHLGTQLVSIYFSYSGIFCASVGKDDKNDEGGCGAGGCSDLIMHLGESSDGKSRNESHGMQTGEETRRKRVSDGGLREKPVCRMLPACSPHPR